MLQLGSPGEGITGWAVRGLDFPLDGLPVVSAAAHGSDPVHPNGAIGVDHLVVVTPAFERTAAALRQAGMELRRIVAGRGGARMGFRRLGGVILELVEAAEAGPGPARFWGLTFVVADLDALAARLGERLGPIRAAVQPGRRIATLRPPAGLGQAVAFMTPAPGAVRS